MYNKIMNPGTRLQAVADMLNKCKTIADIGADHGYLSIYLAETDMAETVIAVDINEKPAAKARANIQKAGLSDRIEVIVGDGLNALPIIPDAAVIAGIGGITTANIIKCGMEKARNIKKLVLQPANREDIVRACLLEEGFLIEREDMVSDCGRLYVMISASYGACHKCAVEAESKSETDKAIAKQAFYVLYGYKEERKVDGLYRKYLERKRRYTAAAIAEIEKGENRESLSEMKSRLYYLDNILTIT